MPPVGRTDAGVHAAPQMCRLRLEKTATTVTPDQVYGSLLPTNATATNWKCLAVTAAPKDWHPTFQATSRSYLYLTDLDERFLQLLHRYRRETCDLEAFVQDTNVMLERLQNQELCYYSYSVGKPKDTGCNCSLTHAQAHLLQEPTNSEGEREQLVCMAIELTGNRFLRPLEC